MQKDVIVTIEDVHITDGDKQEAELMTTGVLNGCGDNYSLTYNEQDSELRDCVTVLDVEGQEKICMTRKGTYQAEFVMEKGVRHNCQYVTPHGSMLLGVYTSEIISDMNETGGTLCIKYTLDFGFTNLSTNELKISVKEARNNVCVG